MAPDHYRTLQVLPDASEAVIRSSYRVLIQQYHPDRHTSHEDAEEMTRRLNEAYRILSDPDLRAAYDAERAGAATPSSPGSNGGDASPTPTPKDESRAFVLTVIRIFQYGFGLICAWQVIGLLPVFTWAINPSAITSGMALVLVIKMAVMLASGAVFVTLDKMAARRGGRRVGLHKVVAALGAIFLATLILGVSLAVLIPNLLDEEASHENYSQPAIRGTTTPSPAVGTVESAHFDQNHRIQASTRSDHGGEPAHPEVTSPATQVGNNVAAWEAALNGWLEANETFIGSPGAEALMQAAINDVDEETNGLLPHHELLRRAGELAKSRSGWHKATAMKSVTVAEYDPLPPGLSCPNGKGWVESSQMCCVGRGGWCESPSGVRRAAATTAGCEIKPTMTDAEIAACR